MKKKSAKKCFNKLLKLHSDPAKHSEKFYLFLGLSLLADDVDVLKSEMKTLRRNVTIIQRKMRKQVSRLK